MIYTNPDGDSPWVMNRHRSSHHSNTSENFCADRGFSLIYWSNAAISPTKGRSSLSWFGRRYFLGTHGVMLECTVNKPVGSMMAGICIVKWTGSEVCLFTNLPCSCCEPNAHVIKITGTNKPSSSISVCLPALVPRPFCCLSRYIRHSYFSFSCMGAVNLFWRMSSIEQYGLVMSGLMPAISSSESVFLQYRISDAVSVDDVIFVPYRTSAENPVFRPWCRAWLTNMSRVKYDAREDDNVQ